MTKSSAFQTVLKLLPALKPHERVEVKKRLDLLNDFAPTVQADSKTWLEDCICAELVRRGVSHKLPDGYWRKWAPKGYAQTAELARQFLFQSVSTTLSSAQKYALGQVTARALADYLANTPGFGLKVMLQGVSKIPQALDASYPGYAAAGKLGFLIKVKL